jgi:outer membrane protein TolC
VSKTATFLSAALIAAAVPAAAQEPSPEKVRALIAQAMAQTAPEGVQVAQPDGPRVDLTAEEAVARALERNLNIVSERLTPRTWDYSLAAVQATYRPTVISTLSTSNEVQLNTSIFSGGSRVTNDNNVWNAGINQSVPWGGGNFAVNFNNSRAFTDAVDQTFNPSYSSNFQARYTQPLLRNFKIDNTRTQLETTRISQQIADINLRATVASTVAQVRNAYWELVYAVQNVEAALRSLELASKLVADNKARVEIGTMAPIDVVQAQAEEATRRQQLVNAQATLRISELALKRLIVGGTDDELWRASINPVDQPSVAPEALDVEGALSNALQNRTDLLTAKKNLDTNNITLESQRNQTLPQLDLVGTYLLRGRGGDFFPRDGSGMIPGGYWDALAALGNFDAPTWTAQANFSWPIGQSAAEANVARTRLLLQQNQTNIKTVELQIATDVTSAALAVRNSLEGVQAATASRELSERRLEAAQSKFEVGMATNFEVVQAQRDLVDARNRELREQLNYRRALVDFQRVQISPR